MNTIPIVETYRGVGVHDFQPAERIETVVKPEVDEVYQLSDPAALAAYAANRKKAPEARLFAAARCEAAWELAAEDRALRPRVDMERMRVSVIGLASLTWIDPLLYTTTLDAHRDAVPRDEPLIA